jgi:hypothetical protein
MSFKKPVVNKIVTDIKNLTIYIRTLKKFGKSTLFRDTVLEKYGDPERGLLVGLGAEVGYNLLDDLNRTHIETWAELNELKNWLIKEKGKEHNIELIAFDVVDELMPIVEKEVIRQSVIDTKKPCKSINAAYGGYGAGQIKVVELAKEFFLDLKKSGIGVWAIAHTKFKNIKQKGDIDEGYMSLSSTLQSNYESIFGDIFDCVLTGYIDRELEEETIQVGDDEKKIRHATGEIRKLYLRGNTFIDAGCRFKDGSVPDFIVFDQPNMAKTFIDTLENGMRLSMSGAISEKDFQQIQKKNEELGFVPKVTLGQSDDEENAQVDLEEDTLLDEQQEETIDIEHNKQLKGKVAGKYKTATPEQKAKVKEILGTYGAAKLDETKPSKMFEDILAIL